VQVITQHYITVLKRDCELLEGQEALEEGVESEEDQDNLANKLNELAKENKANDLRSRNWQCSKEIRCPLVHHVNQINLKSVSFRRQVLAKIHL